LIIFKKHFIKKKIYTIILLLFLSLCCLQSFSQVNHPCGVYYIKLDGSTFDLGDWDKVFPTNDYTLTAWVQLIDTVWQSSEMDIFQRKVLSTSSSDLDDGLDLYLATNGEFKYRAYIVKNGISVLDSFSSGVKPEPWKWYHVALTFKSTGESNFYINGNLVASKSFGGGMAFITINSIKSLC
jgi:hypothetical protein